MVPSTEAVFDQLANGNKLGNYTFERVRSLKYLDTYWDTANGDLHASSRLIRSRERNGKTDFIEFKGPPVYLMQTLFARPLMGEAVQDVAEAEAAFSMVRPSAPLQALYLDRPDLIGRPLRRVAQAEVSRTNVDISASNAPPVSTLSFHTYVLKTSLVELPAQRLVEVQPFYKAPIAPEILPGLFETTIKLLLQAGFRISTVSKYHRLPRAELERALTP